MLVFSLSSYLSCLSASVLFGRHYKQTTDNKTTSSHEMSSGVFTIHCFTIPVGAQNVFVRNALFRGECTVMGVAQSILDTRKEAHWSYCCILRNSPIPIPDGLGWEGSLRHLLSILLNWLLVHCMFVQLVFIFVIPLSMLCHLFLHRDRTLLWIYS